MPKNSKKLQKADIVRSSAAEYLTFIAATGESNINAVYADEDIWLTQKMLALLYSVEVNTINYHLKKIFSDHELDENSVIRNFRITADDGKNYDVKHYNLSAIIAVGFKVDNAKAIQFRKWANTIIDEFTVKGFAMDDERLKNGGTILTQKYFDELLERIREIRLSERKFYQKITDIYATSIDYDSKSITTKNFFAKVQNKFHWAIHGETAAETIKNRASSEKKHMGLTNWQGAPSSKIHSYDVTVAKNYLTEQELHSMQRIVSAYLDLAEEQAEQHVPMTMNDWAEHFNQLLSMQKKDILKDNGKIGMEAAKKYALTEFEKYRVIQDRLFKSDFDKVLIDEELEKIEKGKGDE